MPLPVIYNRRSIRVFEQREVGRDLIDEMLEAARLAPSAGNIQSFRALVVSEPSELAACRSAAYGIGACATAPLIIVCMADVTAAESIGERYSELLTAGALEPVDVMALRSGAGRPFELRLGRDIALVNAAISTEHMALQATADGLGTCWVHHFDHDQLRQEFDIPASFELLSLLAVGWPAEHPAPRPRIATVEWKRP